MSDYRPTIDNIRRAWAWWRKPMLDKKHYFPDDEALFTVTDREFDRWLEQVKAEAWDEGHHAGQHNEHEHRPRRVMTNPYRQETQA